MSILKNLTNVTPVLWFLRTLFPVARHLGLIGLTIISLGFAGNNQAFAAKWDPVAPADLAAKDSVSFPGADIEILLSTNSLSERARVKFVAGHPVASSDLVLTTEKFVRAKVYTAKGVEDRAKLSIKYASDFFSISNTKARVVKPDGTSTELKKDDIIESVLAKGDDDESKKQITFVFPGLTPGDVVEYRWTEDIDGEISSESFFCQEAVPTREYRFTIGKMTRKGTVGWLNCPNATSSEKDGFELVVRDQPAFEEEEHMPPDREIRGWVYMAKTYPMYSKDADIWDYYNEHGADDFNRASKPGAAIKKKAETLVVGLTDDDEKLQRLYEFCQREIFNTTFRTSAELQAGIDKHKDEDAFSPTKILDRGHGRRDEINLLFAALARGLGFEAKAAKNASRTEILNVKIPQGWTFIKDWPNVAIKRGERWAYFNPGNCFVPFGLIDWRDEGAIAMLCNPKKLDLVRIPRSLANQSAAFRKARLTLDAEGTLEGEIEETFTGHLAEKRKWAARFDSIEEASKLFREEKTKRLPNAEVSDIVWTNLQTSVMPLTVKYHVRVPGYAELAGKRLIFAPAYFQAGKSVVFAAAERKYPIFFYYPWAEHDDIEIVLPTGYTLEKPSAPIAVGELTGAFGAQYKLQYNGKVRTFVYRRDFALGANGVCAFAQQSYPALKVLFEQLYKSDTHSIVLKPKAAPVAQAATPETEKPAAPATL